MLLSLLCGILPAKMRICRYMIYWADAFVKSRQSALSSVRSPSSECVAEVGQALKAGIRTIKVKVGANDKHDIELIKQLREKYGYEYILRVDADGAWGM